MLDEKLVYIIYIITAYLFWIMISNTPDFVKYYTKFLLYIISTQIASVITIPIMAVSPRNGNIFARLLLPVTTLLGLTWHLRNDEILREERAAIVIANHQSSLDILGLYKLSYVAKKLAPVCKKEILFVMPFGLAAYLIGCVFIDRKTPELAHGTLKASAEEIFKDKAQIFMFPEGTRNKDRFKMQPFKKGAFKLAIDCQVPIIPLVISPYYFLDAKKKIFNRGHVIVQCLDPVPTTGLKMDHLSELKDRVQNMMEIAYEQLGKEIANTTLAKL